MVSGLKFHHTGVAAANFEKSLRFYEEVLGFALASPIVEDDVLKVRVCLLALPGVDAFIELVGPLGDDSPVNAYLKRGMTYYHACYVASDFQGAIDALKARGAAQILPPTPAKLFGGRRVTFLMTRETGLIELLEA